MKKNRIAALLMAVCLLLSTAVCAEDEADTPSGIPSVPEVTVTGVQVTNSQYFELSLHVSAKKFQTVGVVLSYDANTLLPVTWGDGTAIPVTGNGWESCTAIPTKGMDGIAGKPALAYAEYGSDGALTGRAYLYLGADVLTYTPVEDAQVVTVRFQLAAGKQQSDITMPEVSTGTGPYTVELVARENDAVLKNSIPGTPAVVTVGAETGGGLDVYTDAESTFAVKYALGPGSGLGNSAAPPAPGGDYAITFFDWDGRVIDAITAESDAQARIEAWQAQESIQERLGNKKGYQFERWLVVEENNDGEGIHTVNGAFTSYDLSLANMEAAGSSDPSVQAEIAAIKADTANLSDLESHVKDHDAPFKSVLLQASYSAKSAANGSTEPATELVNGGQNTNAAKQYNVIIDSWTRYGDTTNGAGKYGITVHVSRNHKDGHGVTRLRKPGLVIKMTPTAAGAQDLWQLVELENTDETTCVVVPTKAIGSVAYQVVELYGESNWTNLGAKSDVDKDNKDTNVEKATFVKQGSLGYLGEQAYLAHLSQKTDWDIYADGILFKDAGYPSQTLANVKQKLIDATAAKGSRLSSQQVANVLGGDAWNAA